MSDALAQTTADLVSAYVSNNSLRAEDLAGLIRSVYSKLVELTTSKELPAEGKPETRMPLKRTIMPGYLVSLEDGKRYQVLRRHLTNRGMTPDDYRAKWGLPADYPMVAKDYAERRSALAKSIGLGRKPANADQAASLAALAEAEQPVEAVAEKPAKKERAARAAKDIVPDPKPKDRAKAKKASKTSREDAEVVA